MSLIKSEILEVSLSLVSTAQIVFRFGLAKYFPGRKFSSQNQTTWMEEFIKIISAHADGGPRSPSAHA
jgi:hypothetical protein